MRSWQEGGRKMHRYCEGLADRRRKETSGASPNKSPTFTGGLRAAE